MQNNENIIRIGKALPFGSKKIISERTGITQKTIGEFFKGENNYRCSTYLKVMTEATKILQEIQESHLKTQAMLSLNKKLANDINTLFKI
jgi:predicted transcriptional regulator